MGFTSWIMVFLYAKTNRMNRHTTKTRAARIMTLLNDFLMRLYWNTKRKRLTIIAKIAPLEKVQIKLMKSSGKLKNRNIFFIPCEVFNRRV
jgi:hypothetical protein